MSCRKEGQKMTKRRKGRTYSAIRSILAVILALAATFTLPITLISATITDEWITSGSFNKTGSDTYSLSPQSSLSQLTYSKDLNGIKSVKFMFNYTDNTLAGDHWIGVCVDGWWHQLFLNASHATALPYMAIYAPGAGSPTFTRIDSRIPREDIPYGKDNILR